MAFSDFYLDTGSGSNLNAGSTAGAAVYTSTAGTWDGTSLFTPTDGQTTTSLVSVGDWASVYPTGNSITPYVAQVTAVGVGVNGTITLSTTAKFGTAPVSGTGTRVCKTGGAWADLGLCAAGGVLNTGTVTQSTRINVKAGTYANTTTARQLGLAGTTSLPLHIRGYKTAIGDQDNNPNPVLGTDIPQFTWTTQKFTATAHQTYSSIAWLVTTGSVVAFSAASPTTLYSCFIENQAANVSAQAISGSVQLTLIGCQLKTNALANIAVNAGASLFSAYGCTFRGGLIGVSMASGATVNVQDCVFDGQASDAIGCAGTGGITVAGCSIYNPGGNGVALSGAMVAPIHISNNHFENCNQAAKAGINLTGSNPSFLRIIGNSYFNCTANTAGLSDQPLPFDNGTLGSSGFAAPGSHDFTPTPALLAIGFPGAFRGETYIGYQATGAVQAQPQGPCGGYLGMP